MILEEGAEEASDSYLRSLEQLQELKSFRGEPERFWHALLRALTLMAGAHSGAILVRTADGGAPWRLLAVAPQSLNGGPYAERMARRLERKAEQCEREGVVQWSDEGERLAALRLDTGERGGLCIAAFAVEPDGELPSKERARRLLLAADVPAAYQAIRLASEARTTVERIAGVLDLMILLNEKKRFLAAAMTFCNEISSRLRCERASLGWVERGYLRLQATSHIDRFDRKSDAVHLLEAAMEEAADQNCEVSWPEDHGGGAVTRDHRSFARSNDSGFIYSLPLRVDGEVAGVCTCERTSTPFSAAEIALLRLFCDQPARRLSDLKERDRWIGARLASGLRHGLGKLFGYEHTWLKVLGLVLAALAAFLVFGRVPFRVTAPLTLKTDDVAVLSAPFAGHISKVDVRVGDRVRKGQELLELSQTSLLLTQAQILAQIASYQSQAEKALATDSLANMRIAQANEAEARARYDLARYQLEQSVVRAPFSGVVVQGDLIGHEGLPVQQGQTLFKVARIAGLYASLDVNQDDIRRVRTGLEGEMALASDPGQVTPIVVTRIEPEALVKPNGNVFRVDSSFPGGPQGWWRPGMTGIAKLSAGKRSPLWIVTHRTVSFLRLRFW